MSFIYNTILSFLITMKISWLFKVITVYNVRTTGAFLIQENRGKKKLFMTIGLDKNGNGEEGQVTGNNKKNIEVVETSGRITAELIQSLNIWEEKACIIRNAFDVNKMFEYGYCPTMDDLFDIGSEEEDAESRLVEYVPGDMASYDIVTGPFDRRVLETKLLHDPSIPSDDSTHMLIVNDIERYIPTVGDYMDDLVSFIPRCMRDDGQISLSSRKATIGLHLDNYNAFLLQMAGDKEWSLGTATISRKEEEQYTIPNIPLKVLHGDCCTANTFVLYPGDLLYIPPRIAHKGIALHDQCMTFSIGCKSPTTNDLFLHLVDEIQQSNTSKYPFIHQPYKYTTTTHADRNNEHCGLISPTLQKDLKEMMLQSINAFVNDDAQFQHFIGSYLTTSKRLRSNYPIPFHTNHANRPHDQYNAAPIKDDTLLDWSTPKQVVHNVITLGVGALYQTEGVVFSYTTNPPTLFIHGAIVHTQQNSTTTTIVDIIANHRRLTRDLFHVRDHYERDDMELPHLLERLLDFGYLYAVEE